MLRLVREGLDRTNNVNENHLNTIETISGRGQIGIRELMSLVMQNQLKVEHSITEFMKNRAILPKKQTKNASKKKTFCSIRTDYTPIMQCQ